MTPVRFAPEVPDELAEAALWYEARRQGLGTEFLSEVETVLPVAELSDDLLPTMRDLFAECSIPGAELGVLHLSGALNERDDEDGAVGNRDARFVIGAKAMWEPGEPGADAFPQWIRDAWQRLRRFSTGGNYINFQTADEDETRVRATYRANFHRLVEAKKRYDPDNLFRVNRNIRVAGS